MMRGLIVLLSGVFANAATYTAASASYSDVTNAIASATHGDIVDVPSGTATWASQLSLTKGITLRGAGTNQTIISANLGKSAFVWTYVPSAPASDHGFRVTGFTFNLQDNTLGFRVFNDDSTNVQTHIRIDHNVFTNCPRNGPSEVTFNILGATQGVFDHNVTYGEGWWHNDGNQANDWNNRTFEYGTTNSFYLEDNVFQTAWGMCGAGWGGRFVARYNEHHLTANNLFPWFDIHGNQGGGVYAAMGAEIYGNILYAPNVGINGVRGLHHRGGKAVCFYNLIVDNIGSSEIFAQEEYTDSLNPENNPQTQHISDSYYWNNREGGESGVLWALIYQTDGTSTDIIGPNTNFWFQGASFNGTIGVGVGTLAARPATCTTGVGYWATDQSANTVPLTSIGPAPSAPLTGTLYKATATDTWTAYYSPLVYPHPLVTAQDGGGEDPPVTAFSGNAAFSGAFSITQ